MPTIEQPARSTRRAPLRLAILFLFGALILPAGAPVLASTDAPDSCGAAMPLAAHTWHRETISTSGDVDWFKFHLTATQWVLVTLGDLGADDRLDLFGACGHRLASSDRPGNQYEEIYQKLPAGSYRVRVRSSAGAVSSTAYALRIWPLAKGVYVLSSSGWDEFPSEPRVAGEVLNNTGKDRESIKIRVRFYDAANNLLATRHTWARADRLGAHERSMFVWADEVFAGYDHYRVKVVKAPLATVPAFSRMTVTPGGTTPDGYGGLTFHGKLTNPTPRNAGNPRVMLTIYDQLGRVKNADFTDPTPNPLLAHSSTTFDIYLSDRNTGNRVAFTTYGDPRHP
jgi:hypothetical protein